MIFLVFDRQNSSLHCELRKKTTLNGSMIHFHGCAVKFALVGCLHLEKWRNNMKQCKTNGIHEKINGISHGFRCPLWPPLFWRWHPIVVVAGQQLTIQGGDLGQMFQDLGTRGTLLVNVHDWVQKTISTVDLCDWVLTI